MLFLSLQQLAANTNNNADDNQLAPLQNEVSKLQEEKNTLQERLKKANEENLNLIEKTQVCILKIFQVNIK